MFDLFKVSFLRKKKYIDAFTKVEFKIQNTVLMHDTLCLFISANTDV